MQCADGRPDFLEEPESRVGVSEVGEPSPETEVKRTRPGSEGVDLDSVGHSDRLAEVTCFLLAHDDDRVVGPHHLAIEARQAVLLQLPEPAGDAVSRTCPLAGVSLQGVDRVQQRPAG